MTVYEIVNIEHHKISQSAIKTLVDTFSYYTVFSFHKQIERVHDFLTSTYVDGKPSYPKPIYGLEIKLFL